MIHREPSPLGAHAVPSQLQSPSSRLLLLVLNGSPAATQSKNSMMSHLHQSMMALKNGEGLVADLTKLLLKLSGLTEPFSLGKVTILALYHGDE